MAELSQENDSSKFLLSAINILIATANELPLVDDVDLASSTIGQIAESTIEEVKKAVLSEGWNFNTDENYPFPPDTQGYISVPASVLDITSSDNQNIIIRDWRLYDKANFTHVFEEAVNCDVLWNMDFNSLTHPIRYYITIRAARIFQGRVIGDTDVYSFTSQDEEDAYIACRQSESRTGKYNMFTSQYGSLNGGLR